MRSVQENEMKAKELYAQYLKDLEKTDRAEATYKLLMTMSKEIEQLSNIRRSHTEEGLASIFDEQNRKWNAICKLDNSFKRNGFLTLWKHNIPELKEIL